MAEAEYKVLVCPVCLAQVDRDWETGADCWHEEYGGNVAAVEVAASVRVFNRSKAVEAVAGKLAEQREEAARRKKEREDWKALPKEEREQIEAERWAAMSPEQKALKQVVDGSIADMCRNLNRQPFDWSEAEISAKPEKGVNLWP